MEMFRFERLRNADGVFYDHLSPCKHSSNLQLRLSECRQQFMSEHKLDKMAIVKTWGLAVFQSYIATCISTHPSNMIEYNISTSERAAIVFSHASLEDCIMDQTYDRNLRFPWEAEPQTKDISKVYSAIWDTVFAHLSSNRPQKNLWNCRIVYSTYCASRIWRQYEPDDQESVRAVLHTWAHLAAEKDPEQGAILAETIDIEVSRPEEFVEAANSIIRARSVMDVEASSSQRLLDHCEISECSESLLWTDNSYKARCGGGHLWSQSTPKPICFILLTDPDRCALTFFAIQEPGISRYCDACSREYLHEDYALNTCRVDMNAPSPDGLEIFDNSKNPGNETEGESILQTLFKDYDVCIFCGGKFIG